MKTFDQILEAPSIAPNNLFSLLIQYRVVVPGIQRHYVQGEDSPAAREVLQNFIRDIFTAFLEHKQMHLDFIYGPIRTDGNDAFIPVDGQQRLTTLWLLARYFAEFLDEIPRANCLKILQKFSYEGRLHAKRFCLELTHPQNKLFDEKQKEVKLNITPWCNPYWQSDATVAAMLSALQTISEAAENNQIASEKAKDFLNYIWEQISFDTVTEQFADDIYMKMNARGMPVTRWETFKGKFASALGKDTVQQHWQTSIEELSDLFFSAMGQKETDLPDKPFLAFLGRIIYFIRKKGNKEFSDALKKLAEANVKAELPHVPIADFYLEETATQISKVFLEMLSYLLNHAKECKYPYWSQDGKLLPAVFYPNNENERDLGLILFDYFEYFTSCKENDFSIPLNDFERALRLICNILTNVGRKEFNRVYDIQRFFQNGLSLYGKSAEWKSDEALQYLEESVKGKNKDLLSIMQKTEAWMHGRIRLGILNIKEKREEIRSERLKVINELFTQWEQESNQEKNRKNIVLSIVAAESRDFWKDVIHLLTTDDNLLHLLTTRDDETLQSTLIDFLIGKDISLSPDIILEKNTDYKPDVLNSNKKDWRRDWRYSILQIAKLEIDYEIFNQGYRVAWFNKGGLYLYRMSIIRGSIPISDYRWELWLPDTREKFKNLAKEFNSPATNEGETMNGWHHPSEQGKMEQGKPSILDGNIHVQIFFWPSFVELQPKKLNGQNIEVLRRYQITFAEKLIVTENINGRQQRYEIPDPKRYEIPDPSWSLEILLDWIKDICDAILKTNLIEQGNSLRDLAQWDMQEEYIKRLKMLKVLS